MFELLKINNSSIVAPTIVQKPTTASETYTIGEALKLASGALTKASGTDTAKFICAESYVAPATGMKDISVYPLESNQEYITTFSATPTSLVAGNKVTIHTDGAQVTATTTSGTVEIVKLLGATSGSKVIVKF